VTSKDPDCIIARNHDDQVNEWKYSHEQSKAELLSVNGMCSFIPSTRLVLTSKPQPLRPPYSKDPDSATSYQSLQMV